MTLATRSYEHRKSELTALERRRGELERMQQEEISHLAELRERLERMIDASDPRRSLRQRRGRETRKRLPTEPPPSHTVRWVASATST